MRREWLVCGLLVLLTLSVYWPVRNYDFIDYDDPQYVSENPLVKAGLTRASVACAFAQPVAGNWHPLTVLSHMLDGTLFGPSPGAHHMVSLGLHCINVLLLFLLLRTLTGATWRSALVAAIFALHPLRVESVAWISERKDVLSGSFFLLTIWAWVESRKEVMAGKERPASLVTLPDSRLAACHAAHGPVPRRAWLALALVFYTMGLMSKAMLVTLPFVLLLLDIWPLHRLQAPVGKAAWPLIREKLPFFALSAICSVVTLVVQQGAGAMSFFQHLDAGERLSNAIQSYLRYLGKLVWPTKLAVVYPHPAHGYFLNDAWPWWQVTVGAAALGLISTWCVLRLKRQPYLAMGWFWFLGTLVPVIGLVQAGEQAMANRYTYIPLIGPVICLVWGFYDLAASRRQGNPPPGPAASALITAGAAEFTMFAAATAAIAGLLWTTSLQVRRWRSTVALFDYTLAVTPDNPSAHFALGSGLEKEGHTRWAMVEYRIALAINPFYTKAHYNMGQIFSRTGDIPSAARSFAAALASSPRDEASRLNLAHCLQSLGRVKEAIGHFEEALRRNPSSVEALNNLAWLLATELDPAIRDGKRAAELAERAVALSESRLPLMIGTLAAAYAEAGRFAEAVTAAERAAALAERMKQPEVAARNRELLQRYRSGRPYHEPAR